MFLWVHIDSINSRSHIDSINSRSPSWSLILPLSCNTDCRECNLLGVVQLGTIHLQVCTLFLPHVIYHVQYNPAVFPWNAIRLVLFHEFVDKFILSLILNLISETCQKQCTNSSLLQPSSGVDAQFSLSTLNVNKNQYSHPCISSLKPMC